MAAAEVRRYEGCCVLVMIKKSVELKRQQVRPKPESPQTKRRASSAVVPGRHRSKAAGRKASYALEESAGKPSRKSTRGSANRAKPDSQLVRRAMRDVRSPDRRAARAK
jgi:hypothetical protein